MDLKHGYHEAETALLGELRRLRRSVRERRAEAARGAHLTLGQRVADRVATVMGSWTFIIIQSVILTFWILLNVTAWIRAWDPYPFILLNLALSFQAAYAAPIIMMSQNRQSDIDRKAAETDAQVNVKAELEVELLHQKIDELRQGEMGELITIVRQLAVLLGKAGERDAPEMQEACAVLAADEAGEASAELADAARAYPSAVSAASASAPPSATSSASAAGSPMPRA